jgi:hypothetical protein
MVGPNSLEKHAAWTVGIARTPKFIEMPENAVAVLRREWSLAQTRKMVSTQYQKERKRVFPPVGFLASIEGQRAERLRLTL